MKLAIPPRLRAYPWFFAALTALTLAAGAGAVEAWRLGRRARSGAAEVERLRIERLSSQTQPEMVTAAGAALDRAQAELTQARASWPGVKEPDAARADRLGAYAELMAFVERSRAAAQVAGVMVTKDECFGFGRYAQEAPPEREIPAALDHLRAAEQVLAVLFAAGPEKLNGIWRETPDAAPTGASAGRADEWCVLEPARSVRVPGLVQTRALRVGFVGSTACLRRFLNGLAATPALIVREVAVAETEAKQRSSASQEPAPRSRQFSVTLEAVEVVGGTAKATAGGGAPPPVAWSETQARAGGAPGFVLLAPAELKYDDARRRWSVVAGATVNSTAGHDLGLELIAVRRAPYRWRLVGHVGGSGGGAAMLEDTATRRSVLLRAGERDKASGVVLQGLEFLQERSGGRVARATLTDPGESGPIVLTTVGAAGPERLVAVLRVVGQPEPLVVPEGATVRCGAAEYIVGPMSAEPALVEVTRAKAAGRAAEVRRLSVATK